MNISTGKKFILKAQNIHNKYDYSKVDYINAKEKVIIICPEHGEFKQSPRCHITNNSGCPSCGNINKGLKNNDNYESFKLKAIQIHQDNYEYHKNYINSNTKIQIICPEHGEFEQSPSSHLQGHGCPSCAKTKNLNSKGELEIIKFLQTIGINNIIKLNYGILKNKELDIFLPDYNIAIEYNGLYWHSEKFKSNNYHQNKTNECLSKNIRLIHIFENEWIYNKELVKSRLIHILQKTKNKINARNCHIKIITNNELINFCDNNYLGFYNLNNEINLGLFYQNKLISIMSFNKENNNYILSNYCNKSNTHINGGLFKLLKYFEKTYKPNILKIILNRNWNNDNIFKNNGFKIINETLPNFYYIDRDKLILIDNFNLNKIYDSGNLLLEKIYDYA